MDEQQPTQQMGSYLAGTPAPTQDEKMWGMVAHLSALVASLIGLPFVGPLVVMLVKGKDSAWVNAQAKESLNFQITVTVVLFVAALTLCIGIGFVLLPIVGLAAFILTLVGGIKANNGEMYRYPATLRFIK